MLRHEYTARTFASYHDHLPQALLLTGEPGTGLYTAALELAKGSDSFTLRPLSAKGDIDATNGTIAVELIRQLYTDTQGKRQTRQVVIIDDANLMSRGAQTAFLKLLEEPNEHTHFILTSHQPSDLLPTIRSRMQQTVVHPISSTQTDELLQSYGITDRTKVAQLKFIASGYPAELYRLIHDEQYFRARAQLMTDARDMLRKSTYEKLLIVSGYREDRAKAEALVRAITMILRRTLSDKPQPALVKKLSQLVTLQDRIHMNGNVRLLLSEFVL